MGYFGRVELDDDKAFERRQWRRKLRRRLNIAAAVMVVLVVGAGTWVGVYGHDQGLTTKWRRFVVKAFKDRGIEIDLQRLTFDPVLGLVAREVKIYEDESRQRVMAAIDRVTLDIDYQSLLQGETQINHVDLKKADVSLPLTGAGEPDDGERIEVRALDARVQLTGDRLELRQASGLLEGIRFDVRGTLLKSRVSGWTLPWLDQLADGGEDEQLRSREDLRQRLRQLLTVWREIEWLGERPELQLTITGDLEKWSTVVLDVGMECGPFVHRGWRAEAVKAEVRVTANEASLRSLTIEDEKGQLQAWARLRRAEQEVDFALQSEIGVAGLLGAMGLGEWSRQLVFYDAPRCSMQGTWLLGQGSDVDPETGVPLALDLMGSVDGGRIAASGVVFDRFSADMRMADGSWYVRNFRLQHRSGAVTGEGFRDSEGFRHRVRMQMDLSQLSPFVRTEETRELLRQLELEPDSFVLISSRGEGPSMDPGTWVSEVEVDLRDLMLRGIRLRRLTADMDTGPGSWSMNNVKLEMRGGEVRANLVADRKGVRFAMRSDLSPAVWAPLMKMEDARSWLRRWSEGDGASYDIVMRGVGPGLDPDTWTTRIEFDAKSFVYRGETFDQLTGMLRMTPKIIEYRDLRIRRPEGSGRLTRAVRDRSTKLVEVDKFSGDIDPLVIVRALAPNMAPHLRPYRFSETPQWGLKGTFGPRPGQSACVLDISSGGILEYELFGETVPFDDVGGTVRFEGDQVVFDLEGGLFGGDASAEMVVERGDPPSIAGEVRLRGVPYGSLSRVYDSDASPEGDLTGHFEFQSRLDNARTLQGEGVAILVNGDLVSLPALGPLTPVVGAFLPNPIRDYSVAREASANFQVRDGVFFTDDFEALTSAFRMRGSGSIDPIDDELDFDMSVNLRGAPGVVLLPVSKLLEFKGEGKYSEPNWRPKYLPLPGRGNRDDERAAPSGDQPVE